ncbi:MAG: hydroxyacid-oxoacid transhydrogenase [Natronomonas sp.]|jgi:alcohol dehydrogenase class IV|uniref:hydroxyacid-oxoacid transhydrogenase n=1 Tax=Natronomonas sp. TaxID=2184060 RepID=UPI00286FD6D2|nr:hydroxyacid-oxoacid transhydrogenase [Natronomonas sp.]MDR9429411.1 hydroxyacid-oxoacid transhydrogenase [Natronomonas sp.]
MYQSDSVWEFDVAGSVKFGTGVVEELPEEAKKRGASSVLVVTDQGLIDAGIAGQVTEQLEAECTCEIFDGVQPDPSIEIFERSVDLAREVDPDLIVGVGGGSSIDVAKTTSVVAEHGGDILEYVAPPIGGGKPVPGRSIPSIAVPTTSGTGSETSPVTVLSLPERDLKVGISSRYQYPDLALVDPLLTVSLPPSHTAYSGMDALSHAIEAYVTRRFDAKERPGNPLDRPDYGGRTIVTDQFARTSIELIAANLRRAVDNGRDIEARRNMSLASLLAGVAFTNAGLGATHAAALSVAGEHDTPHGLTVALLLPEVMRFNASSAPDRFGEIASLLGEHVQHDSVDEAAEKAATAVQKLSDDVGIPSGFVELGVEKDEITVLAENAMQLERLLAGNPRRVEREDLEEIFRRSL